MSGNEGELISQFIDVTGSTEERARFYMEASGWDTQLAIASFFEGDHSDQEHEEESQRPPLVASDAPNLLAQLNRSTPAQAGATGQPKPTAKPAPARGVGGLGTLDSLRQQEDSDDEDGEAFFAGGSLTSGQQVLGPPKKDPKKKDEFIKDLFEKAKEHGATAEDPSAASKPAPSFGGAGYKLGDTASSSTATAPQPSTRSGELEPQEVTLRLWSSGFTIDDGELRLYSDANNLEFLNAIKGGELPRELLRNHPGQEVQLAMEDRRHEEYVPPRVPVNPFSGQGHMLGSPTPRIVSATAVNESARTVNEENARSQINLSETEPMTNVQFRLADGTRLVGRFNHTHTVNDLHNFINAARPEFSSANYTLTLFPNRELTDKEVSIKDANVLNAALIQKIKSTG